eukprot:NODE_111_length_19413_cov_0.323703.p9 type:complete len:164 gc:universal NODE_111_length_19413_cov_0.323703:6880-6389(-)
MEDQKTNKSIEWKNPNFINRFGLNKDNCLEYISEAEHIWDSSSSNAVYNSQIKNLDIVTSLESYLKSTPGVQYNLTHHLEDLFIVQKQYRENKDVIYPMNVAYISEGSVFSSPSCADIFRTRTMQSMFKLDSVFETLEDEIHFHPSRGYSFKKNTESSEINEE